MRISVLLITFFFSVTLFSQNNEKVYYPIVNYSPPDSLITYLAHQLKNPHYESSLKGKKENDELKEIYARRSQFLMDLQSKKMLMYNDPTTQFLQQIVDKLFNENKDLVRDRFYVFTVRDNEINAFSVGKGIILINISLLERIKSWQELAFILGHEAGHDILLHAFKSSEQTIKILNDKNLKKKLKEAASKEYGRYTAVSNIYYNLLSLTSEHSRDNEISCDSLGYYLIKNIGLEDKAAFSVLNMLDSADYFLYDYPIDIAATFSNKNYTFNKDWLYNEDASASWSAVEGLYTIPDSLKTHPDCSERILQLKYLTQNGNISNAEINHEMENTFMSLKKSIAFESILTQIESGNYSLSLFNAINIKNKYNDNLFVDYLIAHSLLEIIVSLKNQKFNQHIPFPNKKFPENYNNLLNFLHNCNSSKLTIVYNNFVKEYLNDNKIPEYNNFLNGYYKFYVENFADKELLTYPYKNYYHQTVVKSIKEQLPKKK